MLIIRWNTYYSLYVFYNKGNGVNGIQNPIGDIITFKLCLKTVKQHNRSVFDQSGNFLRFEFSALNFVRSFCAFTL